MSDFSILLGKTLKSVVREEVDDIVFTQDDGKQYRMYHQQECCEEVYIESIVGDLADLVGNPILVAEVVQRSGDVSEQVTDRFNQSDGTWTFYKIATIKGHVDIRWVGSSNGYYSESVDFEEEAIEQYDKQ
jgi:hypothetical protein